MLKNFKSVLRHLWYVFLLTVVCSFSLISCNGRGGDAGAYRGKADTAFINQMIGRISTFTSQAQFNADSAIRLLNITLSIAGEEADPELFWRLYGDFCTIFEKTENHSLALEYYFKQLKLLDSGLIEADDSVKRIEKYASLYVRIGVSYFNIDNFSKALDYYNKSLKSVETLGRLNPYYPLNERKTILFNNIGSTFLATYNFAVARTYFEQALEINSHLDKPSLTATICNNLGIVSKENRQFDRAFQYYNKALTIREQLEDSAGIAQTYNNIGDAQMLTGNYNMARLTLLKALYISKAIGNLKSEMKAANFLTLVYEKLGDYSQALDLYKRFKVLHDSIISNEQVENTANLELKYVFEKQKRESELGQQILLAKKERKALLYLVLSIVLFFSLIILFLLNRQQHNRIAKALVEQQRLDLERKNLTLEKQNLEMEKQQLERDLEFRNKELSAHVLYLIEKNEFIASLITKLMNLKTTQDPGINRVADELLSDLHTNVDNKLWNEFEVRFQQVHQDFYSKLLEKYPDLTPNEIKICAFLKLNMTTKDISSITFQSVKSIQVARNRLRRRMGITRDENLVMLLQQI